MKIKTSKKSEDALRLKVDDFQHDNLKLIEALKNEREIREQLAFECDDDQKKIVKLEKALDDERKARDGLAFEHDDDRDDVILGLGGEIVELKEIVEGLQFDIKDYENRLLDL